MADLPNNLLTKKSPAKGLNISNKFCIYIAVNINCITRISENISLSTAVLKTFAQ